MLEPGTRFGPYEIRQRLAIGGMAEVYLCWHREQDRMDAVKVPLPHLARNDSFRRRFLREARAASRLRHPNLVNVYAVVETGDLLYLAMEYLPGEDLGAVLDRSGPVAPRRLVRLLRPVADALDAAHRVKLVHRDIKPRNLLLSDAGSASERLTVVDFGVSRLLDDDDQITKTGEIVGTIAYCSPEQLSRRPLTGACDQYSLACVAYECLTGQVPFPREGQLAIMTAHLNAPVPAVTPLRPELPAAVDAVLTRALAKDPNDRYANCSHFITALDNALHQVVSAPAHPAPTDTSVADWSPHELLAAVRFGGIRGEARPDGLVVGVGVGPDAAPIRLRLDAGPVALRGDAEHTAGVLRWLVAQLVAASSPRLVCLAAALSPVPGENWLWLHWLAHARPSTPPLSGPHVATTEHAADDLVARLRALIRSRLDSRGDRWPAVVAFLDSRLGVQPADWADAGAAGVHVAYLVRPHATIPEGMAALELGPAAAAEAPTVAGDEAGTPDLPATWSATTVDHEFVREILDLLPD